MAEKYGFFNSVNKDRRYDASDVADFLSNFFTNGVFNNGLAVSANDNMTVSVATGNANINGYSYKNTDTITLNISDADSTLSRIDSVVLRLDLTNRQINVVVISGDTATSPSQPNLTRSGNIYDLRLANISVPTGATSITAEMITDTRFTDDCGNVVQAVQSLSTEDIFKQYNTWFTTWFDNVKGQLSTDVAGNLQNEIDVIIRALGLEGDTYQTSQVYMIGDMVIYKHIIYTCNTDKTSGEFDASKWDVVPILSF